MKKILILGSQGMAGHMITRYFQKNSDYKITTVARNFQEPIPDYFTDITTDLNLLKSFIVSSGQDVIINCIGLLVKEADKNPAKAIYINSYFPHWLEEITKNTKIKVIHLSTDCVFYGDKKGGFYTVNDIKNGVGFYAQSKSLGEIINDKDLTIRMSIIGPEIKKKGTGLFHWFMHQTEEVGGYSKAYWNGITTLELAKQIKKIIDKNNYTGLIQLAPNFKISKYNLLKEMAKIWNKNIKINPNSSVKQDKSLESSIKNIKIVSYKQQLQELKSFMETENDLYKLFY